MRNLPILAVTMGDPAGIGPEISIKAFQNPRTYDYCRPLIIGDPNVMQCALDFVEMTKRMKVHTINNVKDAIYNENTINVYDINLRNKDKVEIGKVSSRGGEAAYHSVETAIRLALEGEVDATVTNALNKEALNLAGYKYSGHTEIYAELTKTKKYSMMLAHENIRVVHVSTHVSLRKACDLVKKERVLSVIELAQEACKSLGLFEPRIAVAGLNPHSGENGLFGEEEIDEIIPAIKAAQAKGILVEGPVPPDTIFSKAKGGWYDIVVAMYHDQGHIPLKLLGFDYDRLKKEWKAVEGVNITLGLPIIRTSVDHGTAFDLAGTGKASALSLMNAMEYAAALSGQLIME